MSEQANAFRLGLFVIVASLLLVGGLAFLGAWSFTRNTVRVETYFEDSIEGLEVGAPVKHRGVTVGRVSQIGFVFQRYDTDSDESIEGALLGRMVFVVMDLTIARGDEGALRRNLAASVDLGLRARLESSGLLGATFLELAMVEPARNPAFVPDWEPKEIFVPSSRSVRAQLSRAIEQIAYQFERADFGKVLSSVEKLADSVGAVLGETDLSGLGENASALLAELRESNARLREILNDDRIGPMIGDAADSAASLRRILTGSEEEALAVVGDIRSLVERASSTMAKLDELVSSDRLTKTLDDLSRVSDEAAPAAAEARLLIKSLNALVAEQRQDLEAIMVNLRRVLSNAAVITEDAKQNPARLLFGEPPAPVNPSERGSR